MCVCVCVCVRERERERERESLCVSGEVVPTPKVTPNSANKLFTQLKAPSTSSECKILNFMYKPLTLLVIRHPRGFCGAQCIFCTLSAPFSLLSL